MLTFKYKGVKTFFCIEINPHTYCKLDNTVKISSFYISKAEKID